MPYENYLRVTRGIWMGKKILGGRGGMEITAVLKNLNIVIGMRKHLFLSYC